MPVRPTTRTTAAPMRRERGSRKGLSRLFRLASVFVFRPSSVSPPLVCFAYVYMMCSYLLLLCAVTGHPFFCSFKLLFCCGLLRMRGPPGPFCAWACVLLLRWGFIERENEARWSWQPTGIMRRRKKERPETPRHGRERRAWRREPPREWENSI